MVLHHAQRILRGDRARREFAQGSEDIAARKERQLEKAQAALARRGTHTRLTLLKMNFKLTRRRFPA